MQVLALHRALRYSVHVAYNQATVHNMARLYEVVLRTICIVHLANTSSVAAHESVSLKAD